MYAKEQKSLFEYFTKEEMLLWCISATLIVVSFFMFDRENYLTLVYIFFILLLWRNNNLFGNDCSNGFQKDTKRRGSCP